jgi:hypothetical protein
MAIGVARKRIGRKYQSWHRRRNRVSGNSISGGMAKAKRGVGAASA